MNNQIQRIQKMEEILDRTQPVLKQLLQDLETYQSIQPLLETLSQYDQSGEWMEDYEADEAGQLPETLKRGVLGQDTLWNLLILDQEIHHQMETIVKASLNKES